MFKIGVSWNRNETYNSTCLTLSLAWEQNVNVGETAKLEIKIFGSDKSTYPSISLSDLTNLIM